MAKKATATKTTDTAAPPAATPDTEIEITPQDVPANPLPEHHRLDGNAPRPRLSKDAQEKRDKSLELHRFNTETRINHENPIKNNRNKDQHLHSVRTGERFVPDKVNVSAHLFHLLPEVKTYIEGFNQQAGNLVNSKLLTPAAKAARYGSECSTAMAAVATRFDDLLAPLCKERDYMANEMQLKITAAKTNPDTIETRNYMLKFPDFTQFVSDPNAMLAIITAPKTIQRHGFKVDDKRLESIYTVALGETYEKHNTLTTQINQLLDEHQSILNQLSKGASDNSALTAEMQELLKTYK